MGEVRFWAAKYVVLAWVLGANITFFGYQVIFRHLKPFIGVPITIATFFLSRNLLMKACMDKIYFPLQPLYQRLRNEEKKKVEHREAPRSEDLEKYRAQTEQRKLKTAEE